jgi:hypothetical protein
VNVYERDSRNIGNIQIFGQGLSMTEKKIEKELIEKLGDLKYSYRQDIRDRTQLEQNFREKFETLNRVHLTDGEFSRLLEKSYLRKF